MALFGSNESKEAKQAAKTEELLKRFGLEDLNDPRDVEAVKSIANALTANKFIEFGTILSGSGGRPEKTGGGSAVRNGKISAANL